MLYCHHNQNAKTKLRSWITGYGLYLKGLGTSSRGKTEVERHLKYNLTLILDFTFGTRG
jgi:hypothetical protein